MGRMSDIDIDIQEMLCAGYSVEDTAKALGVPVQWVEGTLQGMEEFDESMDGDHDTAMASAGFGTDEDYGYFGEDAPF